MHELSPRWFRCEANWNAGTPKTLWLYRWSPLTITHYSFTHYPLTIHIQVRDTSEQLKATTVSSLFTHYHSLFTHYPLTIRSLSTHYSLTIHPPLDHFHSLLGHSSVAISSPQSYLNGMLHNPIVSE